jgi:hypothetical protein
METESGKQNKCENEKWNYLYGAVMKHKVNLSDRNEINNNNKKKRINATVLFFSKGLKFCRFMGRIK